MQIDTTYSAMPLMMHPAVAQQAHQAMLAQNPELASVEAAKSTVKPSAALLHPTNSIDILI